MRRWISRIMTFVFLLNTLSPEILYAQRYSSGSSKRPTPVPTYQPAVIAPTRAQLQRKVENQVDNASQRSISMASSEKQAEELYAAQMSPLLDKYDELEARSNYAELAQVVENMHNLVDEYKLWCKSHQAPEPMVAESTAYRRNKGRASLEEVLHSVDTEEGDTLDLVEAIDPLSPANTKDAKSEQAMQTAYAAEILLQSLDSTTQAEASELRDFLPRLYARGAYRLKHVQAYGADNIMQRGALRMLLHETSDVCAEVRGGCPSVDYFPSFVKEAGKLKDSPDDLNLELQYAVRYAVFNLRAPEKLAALVTLLEEKPGRRPTRFETQYSPALGTLLYALVDAVAQTPRDKETVEKAQRFLVSMAGPSHATDTRVFAIGAAARLNKLPLPKTPYPFTDKQRQQLVAYAVDLYHPLNEGGINGARETYGLKADAMKKLADDLVISMRGLLPVTGAETVNQQGKFSPGKNISVSFLDEKRALTSSGRQVEMPTYLYGSDGYPQPIFVYNGINIAQQNKEYTLKFWSEAFTWIFFGEVLKAGFLAFKLVGRAVKVAPRALKAARVASKGKKLGRFSAKMRQGIKYGTKVSTGKATATVIKVENKTPKATVPAGSSQRVGVTSVQTSQPGVRVANRGGQPGVKGNPAMQVPQTEPIPNLPKAKKVNGGSVLPARKTPSPVAQQQSVTGALDARVEAARETVTARAPVPEAAVPVQKSAGQKTKEWLQDYWTALRRPSGTLQMSIPGIPAPGSFKAVRAERAMREAAKVAGGASRAEDAGIKVLSVTTDGVKVRIGQTSAGRVVNKGAQTAGTLEEQIAAAERKVKETQTAYAQASYMQSFQRTEASRVAMQKASTEMKSAQQELRELKQLQKQSVKVENAQKVRAQERAYGKQRRAEKAQAKAEQERLAQERAAKEKNAKAMREKERTYGQQRRAQKQADAKAEQERLAQEAKARAEQERLAREAEEKRLAQEAEQRRLAEEKAAKEKNAKAMREKERTYGQQRRAQKNQAKAEAEAKAKAEQERLAREAEEKRLADERRQAEEARKAEQRRLENEAKNKKYLEEVAKQNEAEQAAKQAMEPISKLQGTQRRYWSSGQESIFVIRDAEVSAEFTSQAQEVFGKLKSAEEEINNIYLTLNKGRWGEWDKVDVGTISQLAKDGPARAFELEKQMKVFSEQLRRMEAVAEGTKATRRVGMSQTLTREVESVLQTAKEAGIPKSEWARLEKMLHKTQETSISAARTAEMAKSVERMKGMDGVNAAIEDVCGQSGRLESAMSDLKNELDAFKKMWGTELKAGRHVGTVAASKTATSATAQTVKLSEGATYLVDYGLVEIEKMGELKNAMFYSKNPMLHSPRAQQLAGQFETLENGIKNLQFLRQSGADAAVVQRQIAMLKEEFGNTWYILDDLTKGISGSGVEARTILEAMQNMQKQFGVLATTL